MTWSGRRKLIINLLLIFLVFLPLTYFLYTKIVPKPTCFDGRKNGLETGVDCGGACQLYCPYERKDPVIVFARAQKIVDGFYNVIALIENKNVDAMAPIVSYKFKLYDEKNVPIATREGTTFINPNTEQAIFEPAINVGQHGVARVVFEFTNQVSWFKTDLGSYVLPVTTSQPNYKIINDKPTLSYVLENKTYTSVKGGQAIVVAYDKDNNAVGFSGTVLDPFLPSSQQTIVFSWPTIFGQNLRFQLFKQVNLTN